jgi:hypothetical protein
VNGWSFLKRLSTRVAAGSLALSLGLGTPAFAQQLPQSLPPYNPLTRTSDTVPATPAILQKDAPSETPRGETAKPESPAPAVIGEPAADCPTCTSGKRHSLFGPHWGGCGPGGCSSGSCGAGGCGAGGCGRCVNDTCGPMACYGCGYGGCFPGHKNCCPIDEGCGPVSRFFACFYHCLCCPDPCYEPYYRVEANSAFWVDGARPVTMTRVRWDSGLNYTQLDRSEFFWARSGGGGKGPGFLPTSVDYNTLSLYQEAAAGKASVFVEQTYSSMSPDNGPEMSGWGDLNLGTKALLFDCELMQVSFQFRTYLPVGQAGKGLGTGHVSLEPSLLTAIKLCPETYFQGQLSEWIPIAADPNFGGSVLHYHGSLNHVLYRCRPDIPLIGTFEVNGYSFQDGLFTVPGGALNSSGDTLWTFGPGLRLAVCYKLDMGFSAVFGAGNAGGPEQLYRTEFRFRF